MISIPYFPMFINLKDKECVFIGGGNVASRKIETLIGFGSKIKVISPKSCQRIEELAMKNNLELVIREYKDGDTIGAYMVFAATGDRNLNHRVYEEAIRGNIPVNVADCPKECTFLFPSIVKRDELVVGISTSGIYPALSKIVRQKIEGILPESLNNSMEILKHFRAKAVFIKSEEKRKSFIAQVMDLVLECDDNNLKAVIEKIEALFLEYML